ncbi:unnamed protein product [Chrysodeixis includens]|uniref:Homologous recombination OB-fold protein OB-fold domain-containing protein n=1 Tax=Chrysodeixis includens TaxID=689277 RepID=A0A9P0BRB8_CHRIL|nr:unnamed protein product [Chrysodeixis includens]
MFESDDFDQVLSQFEFPEEVTTLKQVKVNNIVKHGPDKPQTPIKVPFKTVQQTKDLVTVVNDRISNNDYINTTAHKSDTTNAASHLTDVVSPKHTKRKMIHSYFDHKSKRKFPGPAGLLSAGLQEDKDENICQIELLSQDVDFSQSNLQGDIFESPLWVRLLEDLKSWNLREVDSIKAIKHQALTGSLKRRKAHTITAFVEKVDRSAIDPLIIMRDTTGNIKGTLHRDAWSTFSKYIASDYCAFILWKPTILTTGGAFKKHYLNITLSNILAIYSSAVLTDEADAKPLPDNYSIVYEEDYTVIKTLNNLNSIGTNSITSNGFDINGTGDLDELDTIFSDDIF